MEAPKATVQRARSLRRRMTPPEARLWVALRRKAQDWRFRRQHPLGPYVLDFYCDRAKLAVEVDGQTHWLGDSPERDARRDAWLAERGVRTLRISASLVLSDLDAALRMIDHRARGGDYPNALRRRSPSTMLRMVPSPYGGGGRRAPLKNCRLALTSNYPCTGLDSAIIRFCLSK